MKNFKLKKLIAVALVAMTIATVAPVGASAEWRQDSNGWWNTEGNSWSTGWRSISNTWYYFGSDGYMETGWIYDGSAWYFAAQSGAMQTGWINDGGVWYFTSDTGAMQTGVVEIDGKIYYLAPNGAMQTGNVTIDGVTYTFAATGEAIGDKKPTPTKIFTANGTQTGDGNQTGNNGSIGTTTTKHSSGGGGSSSSVSAFQKQINTLYKDYGTFEIVDKTTVDGLISFKVNFTNEVDNSTTGEDFVEQDIFVTGADGKDTNVTYKDGVYTVKSGAKVSSTVRVYRNGLIGYVSTTTATQTIK